ELSPNDDRVRIRAAAGQRSSPGLRLFAADRQFQSKWFWRVPKRQWIDGRRRNPSIFLLKQYAICFATEPRHNGCLGIYRRWAKNIRDLCERMDSLRFLER